ncbi:MAG: efflux RND transporter periplasmic adaptor subunit [Candidatus Gracilibacteria bacterium]|nr:efflux RND transporter periplasmic adaptor subunit [Candidatus Gracilibacteria bacterium]
MKKTFFLALILSSFLLSSCGQKEELVKKYFNTVAVESGSISEGNSYVGYTDSFDTIMLSAKMGGKVVSINKEVGDKVVPSEEVAMLDGSEAKTGYNSRENIITQLQILKSSTSDTFDKQIMAAGEKVKQVQNGIDMASIGISGTTTGLLDVQNITREQLKTVQTQIAQAKTGLETAKLNLANNQDSLDQKKSDIYNNSKNAISNANNLAVGLIDFLDNFYGVTTANKYKNDSFEVYIGAKNTQTKTDAENELRTLISKYNSAKNLPLDTNENIEKALNTYNSLFSGDIRTLLKNTYSVLENSISSSSFPDSAINAYKTQTNTLQANLEQVILTVQGNYFLGLKGSIDSISSFKKESKNGIDMLQKQVALAEKGIDTLNQTYKQYEAMRAGQITDISTKKQVSNSQKSLAQNQLGEALASIEALKQQKISSLKQIDAQIAQVQGGQNDASVMIDNAKVISPINGVVIKKMAEVGQVVGGGMPLLVVATDSDIKIMISIPDDVKQNTFIGDKVKVEIEGHDKQVDGIITNILPTLDPVTKKTQVEIKVLNPENKIKIGSYAKVYLADSKASEKTGLVIPNKAIVSDMLIPGVYILTADKKAKFTNIKILKQNDNFSLIEGLKLGDKIITDGKENVFDGEILQ